MLTKTDLSSLKKIIRQEIVSESKSSQQSLRAEIKLSRIQIQSDIKDLTSRIINIEQQSTKTNKDVSAIRKDIKKIRKDIDAIIDVFDNDLLELRSRTDRVEQFLKLPALNL